MVLKVLIFKKKQQGVVDNSYIEFGKGIVNPDKGKHDCSEKEYDKHGPLRFVAEFSNTPIQFAYYLYTPPAEEIDINSLPSFEFSTDEGKNWNDYQATKKTDDYYVSYTYPKIIVKKGESVLFRGINETLSLSYQSSYGYVAYANLRIHTSFIYAYGDITSLLNNVGGNIPVPERCFSHMFENTMIITPPSLPSTQLAEYCYDGMFTQCTSLTEAPELPATQLAGSCYSGMFNRCTSLNKVTALFTTKPIGYYDDEEGMYYFSYTEGWLYGVAQNGTFVKNASATWDDDEGMMSYNNGCDSIPVNWTVETK